MTANVERLDPPNEHAHLVLPPAGKSSSGRARSHDSIHAVHLHGISFIDQMGAMEGYLTIVAGMGGIFPVWAIYGSYDRWGLDWFVLLMFFLLVICLLILRADTIAYRYQPVLFNRASGKVHVFVAESLTWWKLWQLKPPSRIDTWDWSCIRGEVVEFTVVGGGGVPSKNYALVCAVVERPGSDKVIARFGVGLTMPWSTEPMVERWEHIRRYMRNEGPALAPGDTLFKDESTHKLLDALTFGQPLLGPGSGEYWNGKALNGWWFLTIPAGLVFLILLPFTAAAGLLRWISHAVKRKPTWPAEIMASVGGAIDATTLMTPKLTFTQQRKALKRKS